MDGSILVINAGSSSIKFTLFHAKGDALNEGPNGQVDAIGIAPRLKASGLPNGARVDRSYPKEAVPDHTAAMRLIDALLGEHTEGNERIIAVGHRVVHGGLHLTRPRHVDPALMTELEGTVPLSPVHQPGAIAGIRAVSEAMPNVVQYVCFDTAFHANQPRVAQTFAIPRALTESGVRRYGFHGLSYEYITEVLPEAVPDQPRRRVVVAHLGNGASMSAVLDGKGVAHTMSFTPLDGLAMGTRCGSIDAAVVFYLVRERGMTVAQVEDLLWNRSGLLGISGLSSDMRDLERSNTPEAREAVDFFVYRVVRELGSLAAAMGGLDGLVFTAGIGEHSPQVRGAVLRAAGWMGFELDEAANEANGPLLTSGRSRLWARVIPTNENLMIARHVLRHLARA
jgi:acetate kinase